MFSRGRIRGQQTAIKILKLTLDFWDLKQRVKEKGLTYISREILNMH